jgi:hypothetical protein
MSEARERTVEILKALAFVLVGFFGGVAAMAFIEGFRDGYDSARSGDAPVEQRPAGPGSGTGA